MTSSTSTSSAFITALIAAAAILPTIITPTEAASGIQYINIADSKKRVYKCQKPFLSIGTSQKRANGKPYLKKSSSFFLPCNKADGTNAGESGVYSSSYCLWHPNNIPSLCVKQGSAAVPVSTVNERPTGINGGFSAARPNNLATAGNSSFVGLGHNFDTTAALGGCDYDDAGTYTCDATSLTVIPLNDVPDNLNNLYISLDSSNSWRWRIVTADSHSANPSTPSSWIRNPDCTCYESPMDDNLDYFVDTGCNLLCDENYKANSAVLVLDYKNGCETDYPTETGIDTFFTDTNFRRDGDFVEEPTGAVSDGAVIKKRQATDGCGSDDTLFYVSNYAVIDAGDGTDGTIGGAAGSTVTVTQTTTVTVKSGASSMGNVNGLFTVVAAGVLAVLEL
ncbi:hypothetical protein HDU76_007533 [Blyttiomyces sp. JEL0837]|nr:hypothetical protein HDU76_007533 [Blyttiomyces sp. JEL0837]